METANKIISLADLKIGDEILIYVNRTDGGCSMGRGVEGKKKFLTSMVYAGNVYTDTTGSAYFWDGTPLGLPITERDIQEVRPQNGLRVIRSVYQEKSRLHGGHFTRSFMNLFDSSPFHDGEHVTTNYDYTKENRMFAIRNDHKVLRAKDLIYKGNQGRIAIVWSPSLHKKTLVSIHALKIRPSHES
jgi:hypothetical protein